MTGVVTPAPAKLNLSLDVGALRRDGYHDLRSVIVAIDLADCVTVDQAEETRLTVLASAARGEDEAGTPEGEENLALRAARLMVARHGTRPVHVTLEKRIPAAAGLGGGSSDAAAVIRAVNALYGLGLAAEEQAALGAELGSDVPFFAFGGAALVEGRGERVTPLPDIALWFLVLWPGFAMPRKTAAMFARLDAPGRKTGRATDRVLACWPAVDESGPGNDFEAVAFEAFPSLRELWQQCGRAGAVHLSGAGPSLFVPCPDEAVARARADRLRDVAPSVVVARSQGGEESRRVERAP